MGVKVKACCDDTSICVSGFACLWIKMYLLYNLQFCLIGHLYHMPFLFFRECIKGDYMFVQDFIRLKLRESYEVADRGKVPLITVNEPQGYYNTHTH